MEKLESEIRLLNKEVDKFTENKPADELVNNQSNQKELDQLKVRFNK